MKRKVGSTDIASIAAFFNPSLAADLPKNKTITDVFNRMLWGMEAPRNSRMQRGLDLEQFGLDYYGEHIGDWWRALPLGEWWTVADPKNPDFTASPDAFDSPAHRVVIELKTQSEWARPQWGTPGTSEMANRYLFQVQWLCARCDADMAHVLCLFGNDVPAEGAPGTTEFLITEPAIYTVDRNDEMVAMLDTYAELFLSKFVRPGIPPPVKSAHNRRSMKARLENDHRASAVEDWKRRCAEHAATNGLDDIGRPQATRPDHEARRDDGVH